jgi:hypothetical protein
MGFERAFNIVFAAIGVAVLVGWLRYRGAKRFRDINKAEISEDLTAGDELLEDALTEQNRLGDAGQR